MTARGIAERLVRAHGIDYARGYVRGRGQWWAIRFRQGVERAAPRVTLWDAVLAALEGGR